jgi:hypothetical protein
MPAKAVDNTDRKLALVRRVSTALRFANACSINAAKGRGIRRPVAITLPRLRSLEKPDRPEPGAIASPRSSKRGT